MSTAPERREVPTSPLRQIDLVAEHFERQWRQGELPPIADFLGQVPAELRSRLLAALVCIDLEHRMRQRLPTPAGRPGRLLPRLPPGGGA
jgi:hypothetical protein